MALPTSLMLETLVRMLAAAGLMLVWWPRWALPTLDGLDGADRGVADFARAALVVIAVSYVLTPLQLFSMVSLAVVLALAPVVWRRPATRYQLSTSNQIGVYILAALDDVAGLPRRAWQYLRHWLGTLPGRVVWPGLTQTVLLLSGLFVAVVAVWIRFWANWVHAALPFSDAYVVVYWVKSIQAGRLFPNGVYPKGFHILVAAVASVGGANPILVEKFAGPLVGVLLALSVGYAAWRLTGQPVAGILALLVYGGTSNLLPYTVLRQAATDSQEFGNALVLPLAYFTFRAWHRPRSGYWVGAVSLLAVVALSHFVALVNAAAAAIAGTLAGWITAGIDGDLFRRFARGVGLAALGAIIPMGVPILLGQHYYASSLAFLTRHAVAAYAPVGKRELAAVGLGVFALLLQTIRRGSREHVGAAVTSILLTGSSILLRELPRLGINSVGLLSRSVEYVALAEALAVGVAIGAAVDLAAWAGTRVAKPVAVLLALAAIGVWLTKDPPAPLNPFRTYRINSDQFVAAYIRLDTQLLPGSWLAISDGGGYALSVYDGYHLQIPDFLAHVNPKGRQLRYLWPSKHIDNLIPEPVFLFVHRTIYHPHYPGAEKTVEQEIRDDRALKAWLRAYGAAHPDHTSLWFGSRNLDVYEINVPVAPPS